MSVRIGAISLWSSLRILDVRLSGPAAFPGLSFESCLDTPLSGPYNYQKALYTGKHFYLPKSTEKTHARRGLLALWITFLCVLDNKDVYMWQNKVYNPLT